MQLADNSGRHDPGTGEINYTFLFDVFDKLGYTGWIGCEYKPLTTTEAGVGMDHAELVTLPLRLAPANVSIMHGHKLGGFSWVARTNGIRLRANLLGLVHFAIAIQRSGVVAQIVGISHRIRS